MINTIYEREIGALGEEKISARAEMPMCDIKISIKRIERDGVECLEATIITMIPCEKLSSAETRKYMVVKSAKITQENLVESVTEFRENVCTVIMRDAHF